MKKPEHQWETRQHRAHRRLVTATDGGGGTRQETFELRFFDGTVHEARLDLDRQVVDREATRDPDLIHAVQCWLAARGRRTIELRTQAGDVLALGPFELDELGQAPGVVAHRLVTLAPSNAELVASLGAFDRVVACEDSSDWPSGIERCERLGPDLGPNLDRVAELTPDLVVASLTVPGMERVVTGLRARNIRQVVCAPRSLADVITDLERVGRLLGRDAAARAAIATLESERDALLDMRSGAPVRVYLEWWPRPMFTPGRDCYSNELIALAGGVNVFGDRPGSSVEIGTQDLLDVEPEVCFVSWCGVAEDKLDPRNLIERAGLETLEAAQRGRVHPLDERFSGRPGPRMLEASRRMAAFLTRDFA